MCRSSLFQPTRRFENELLERPANKLVSCYHVCVDPASFEAVQPGDFEAIQPAGFEPCWVANWSVTYKNINYVKHKCCFSCRSTYWWDHIVLQTFTKRDLIENFHVCRGTFLYLCDQLRSVIQCRDTCMYFIDVFTWSIVWLLPFGVWLHAERCTMCVIV